jgi:hypothetical protein
MIIFNHGIVRILVRKKSQNLYWSVVTKKVGPWFGPKIEKKFVQRLWEEPIPIEDAKWNSSYIEDDEIYYKPHCIIYMTDKSNKEVYFETEEELTKYVDELKEKAPHIIV